VCWYSKPWLESGPVTADLITTVIHSYELLINDVKPFTHSLQQGTFFNLMIKVEKDYVHEMNLNYNRILIVKNFVLKFILQ